MNDGNRPDEHIDRSVDAGKRDRSVRDTYGFADDPSNLNLETHIAPSFPGVFRTAGHASEFSSSARQAGEHDGDFEIIRELGRGASGVVYLVRQISLGRRVALKITRNLGAEAKTMALLEHRQIVQVYSESLSKDGQLRLICMQYVPGITLDELIEHLQTHEFDGPFDAEAIGAFAREGGTSPLNAEREERQPVRPQSHDFAQWACVLIAGVADALAYAHRQGVLHLDVKPANILIDEAGRPLLADFSLSLPPAGRDDADCNVFGGTPAYMSPEHLDAFNPGHPAPLESVDQRSDIYSLGLVLYELLTRRRSLPSDFTRTSLSEHCQRLAEYRRQPPPTLALEETEIPSALNWTLAKCLAPEPEDRFGTADEFASALRGCRQLSTIVAGLSTGGRVSQWLKSAPLLGLLLLGTLANLLGVFVGVAYMFSTPRIRDILTESTASGLILFTVIAGFLGTAVNWSVIIYRVRPFLPALKRADYMLNDASLARRHAVQLPGLAALVDALTWLPVYVVIPLMIYRSEIEQSPAHYLEFVGACSVLMIIAVSYTYFFLEYYAVHIYYPRLWTDTRQMQNVASKEMAGIARRLRSFQILAAVVPVSAAVGLVLLGPMYFAMSGYFTFPVLAIVLIVGGSLGLMATAELRTSVDRVVRLFTRTRD